MFTVRGVVIMKQCAENVSCIKWPPLKCLEADPVWSWPPVSFYTIVTFCHLHCYPGSFSLVHIFCAIKNLNSITFWSPRKKLDKAENKPQSCLKDHKDPNTVLQNQGLWSIKGTDVSPETAMWEFFQQVAVLCRKTSYPLARGGWRLAADNSFKLAN